MNVAQTADILVIAAQEQNAVIALPYQNVMNATITHAKIADQVVGNVAQHVVMIAECRSVPTVGGIIVPTACAAVMIAEM